MRFSVGTHPFIGFFPPYRVVEPLTDPSALPSGRFPIRGAAMIWNLRAGDWGTAYRAVRERPPGMALFLLLPPASEIEGTAKLLQLVEHCRPHSILPFMDEVDPEELGPVLRRFPRDFGSEVMEYLRWRGADTDLDTRRIIRKILDLSGELRTVSGLARSLYTSRRALGRRLLDRGLPPPSHWLHFGRILRASLWLQESGRSLQSVATSLGYPDGFSLSNQMKRLLNLRPSLMRECFGWEWVVESWLLQETRARNVSPFLCRHLFPNLPFSSGAREETRDVPRIPGKMAVAEPPAPPRRRDSAQ